MNNFLNKFSIKEMLKFLVGGGSAVIIDFVVYRVLLLSGGDIVWSKGVSYVSGAIVGFIINKLWTFQSKGFSEREIGRYILLYIVSACLNTGVNKVTLHFVDITLVAFLFATGASTVMNFLGQKFFVFVKEKK